MKLTSREYELLAFLLSNQGRYFSRDAILKEVWGYEVGDAATVTVHVGRLRAKMRAVSGEEYIRTVRGVGYGIGRL